MVVSANIQDMSDRNFSYHPLVFDAIIRLQAAQLDAEIRDVISDALAYFGFDRFVLCYTAAPERSFEWKDILVHSAWPIEFAKEYIEQGMHRFDPLLRRARLQSAPFAWSFEEFFSDCEERGQFVLARAADYGLRAGIHVPVHGPNGYRTCMAVSGPRIDRSATVRSAIRLLAVYAVERVFRGIEGSMSAFPITAREREVLTWTAAGKSAWEIGEILKISKRTVDEHIQSTFRKLGAVNRVQAVAIAMRDRLIQL